MNLEHGHVWFPQHQRSQWFHERYDQAASQVVELFGSNFLSLTGKAVADIGCGDGIIDLGVFRRVSPGRLVGFDLRPVDTRLLSRLATEEGHSGELPTGLEFRTSSAGKLDADDESFDFVFSWSAFHHLQNPRGAIHEVRRILRAEGALMIQLYPFFSSPHGSLLEQWYPEGFAQLRHTEEEITATVRSDPGQDPAWAEHLLESNRKLNRVTLDELGDMLTDEGLRVTRLQVIGEDAPIPPEVATRPLSQLGIGGVKLLAVRD
ncbi:MAG: class I SAM-dependent methyltransferase [Actinomycetota bacterium]